MSDGVEAVRLAVEAKPQRRFGAWLLAAWSLASPTGIVWAGPVADAALAGRTPTVTTTASGQALVNIAAPNAAGLSHNRYQRFDVDANGLLLNNSRSPISTALGTTQIAAPIDIGTGALNLIAGRQTVDHDTLVRIANVAGNDKAGFTFAPGTIATAAASSSLTGVATSAATQLLSTGNIDGRQLLSSAVSSGLSGGITEYYGSAWNAERVLASAAVAGAAQVINGGKFEDGFKTGLVVAGLTWLRSTSRLPMMRLAILMPAGRPCNVRWAS
jgi:hypothetical protein